MRTRPVAVVGIALLLALSGCSALNPGTSADSPTTESPTTAAPGGDGDGLEAVTYPAGTGPDGFANTSTVLAAHQEGLASDSYRIAFNLTHARPRSVANTSTIVASNETQARQVLDADLPGRSLSQFASDERSATRLRVGNNTTYDASGQPVPMSDVHFQGATPGELLTTIVESGNYSATGTATRQGRTVIVYETTTVRANVSGQLPDDVERFNASVSIDQEGRIWAAELYATGQTNGTEEIFHQQYRTLAVGGVTVERPAWVANATA